MQHLIMNILPSSQPLHVIYNFIADRSRAIRQDYTLQRCSGGLSFIRVVECMARFHIVFHYLLGTERREHFDPFLNREMLSNCLITLRSACMCFRLTYV